MTCQHGPANDLLSYEMVGAIMELVLHLRLEVAVVRVRRKEDGALDKEELGYVTHRPCSADTREIGAMIDCNQIGLRNGVGMRSGTGLRSYANSKSHRQWKSKGKVVVVL
ncbi:hypothetical protein BHM03_00062383 [Ensete ventricosum]|nr:hypothetical protein BHM03_00062383 [Ensete ventricosum]